MILIMLMYTVCIMTIRIPHKIMTAYRPFLRRYGRVPNTEDVWTSQTPQRAQEKKKQNKPLALPVKNLLVVVTPFG